MNAKAMLKDARKSGNHQVIERNHDSRCFQDALTKAKERNGIDYLRIFSGDEKEIQKYKMVRYQERLDNE